MRDARGVSSIAPDTYSVEGLVYPAEAGQSNPHHHDADDESEIRGLSPTDAGMLWQRRDCPFGKTKT